MIKKIQMSKDVDIPQGIEKLNTSLGIINWGKDNLYGQYLNYLYYTCAVHQGIINRKVAFILGKGLEGNQQTVDLVSPILKGVILNNEISEMYYVLCRLDYAEKKYIKHVKLLSFEKVRVQENGKTYEYKEDWTDNSEEPAIYHTYYNRTPECQYVIYPFKGDSLQYQFDGEGKKLSGNYYPEPSYKSGIKSILTDIEAVDYQFSSFKNSFSVGTILNLNKGNIPNPEDKRNIEDHIQDLGTGSKNASSVLVLYNHGKDTEATVQQLSGDKVHERYIAMSQDVRDNILKAHGVVSPSLFGFQTGGSFNQSEMDVAYILMKDDYFHQRQQQVLEFVNFIDEVNGNSGDLRFRDFNPFKQLEQPQTHNKACNCGTCKTFSEHSIDEVVKVFGEYGEEINRHQFLASESLNEGNEFKNIFSNKFNNPLDLQVLSLIDDGNTFDKIAKSLNITPLKLSVIYKRLIDGESLTNDGQLTKLGQTKLVQSNLAKYEIRYTYEVKDGYGAEIIPTTRDFCRSLIELNRMYTREDITNISLALGMSADKVWNYRGGWYHNPNTGKNERSCRHEWRQNLRLVR